MVGMLSTSLLVVNVDDWLRSLSRLSLGNAASVLVVGSTDVTVLSASRLTRRIALFARSKCFTSETRKGQGLALIANL